MPPTRQMKFDPASGELVAVNAAGVAYALTPTGESPSTYVATTYMFTGSEGTDFFVALSAEMLNANYALTWAPKGCPGGVPVIDLPNGAGDRTMSQFRVQTDIQQDAGDQVEFVAFARAPSMAMRVMILNGQSNSVGLCQASAVTNYPSADLTLPFADVIMFDHVAYSNGAPPAYTDQGPQTLRPRTSNAGGYLAGMGGVELVMARELVANTSNGWRFGKSAVDGSTIAQWNDPALLRDLFITFIAAQMTAAGVTDSSLVTVQFDQGESNVGSGYATYLLALQELFAAIRAAFPGCGILINRISNQVDTTGDVRAAQESLVRSTIGALIVYADDLALRDTAHYTDDSYVTLGERLAARQASAIAGTPATNPQYTGAGPIVSADSASSLTPTMPLHQAGDWLYVVLFAIGNNDYTLTTANGFVEAVTPIHDGGSALNPRLQVWKQQATSGATLSPVIADAASDDFKFAFIIVVRGGDATEAIEDSDASTPATSTAVSFPAGASSGPDRLVLNVMAFANDAIGQRVTALANGGLSDLTQHVNFSTTASVGYSCFLSAGRVGTGPTGNTTALLTGTSPQALLTLVLK